VPSTDDRIIHGLQGITGPPPMSLSQLEAIANLQDIFESWRLLTPPSLRPTRLPAPAHPRVDPQASPRVASPLPPSRTPTLMPSLAWSPPPCTSSAACPPLPSSSTFHATPQCLNFGNVTSPRVISELREPPPPPPAVGLPAQEPKSHRTRSHAPASLALFASGWP
jgi:hypothetical protein